MIKPSVVVLFVVLATTTTAIAQQALSVDESVVRDVAAGNTHAYTIQLNTGDFIAGTSSNEGLSPSCRHFSPTARRFGRSTDRPPAGEDSHSSPTLRERSESMCGHRR